MVVINMIAYKMVKDIYENVEKVRTGKKKNIFDLKPSKEPIGGDFHIMSNGSLMKGKKHKNAY